MELSKVTYLVLFFPGILLGSMTVFGLWRGLQILPESGRKYKVMFVKVFLMITVIGCMMDFVLIYFEAWIFPQRTHLLTLPVLPQLTFYGTPMIIPFEEFFLFIPFIIWFGMRLVLAEVLTKFDVRICIEDKDPTKSGRLDLFVEDQKVTSYTGKALLVKFFHLFDCIF